ncbi:protein-glutamate O-methyltransferase CheR [Neobacillus mesonae]|uniref:CheR family methyltransferase n=1 Tax=Neobacillus mesonae TaxID=1193713 RepID=UPI00203FF3D3|nr:protein-glutamate O-methyltransferase CheR [Neobacillus mesonae]MCM3571094.1 protein-glutamate O-methyltransferase CheR [Neobacillus mesonae]
MTLNEDERIRLHLEEIEKIEIELFLEALIRFYGYDFRNYAFPFLKRRIKHRVQQEHLTSISALQEKVLRDSETMKRLLTDFSINVTEMFRDPSFFNSIRTKVIPIVKNFSEIKIWHVGCSSGEEAYSMAILLYEEGIYEKCRIFATDLNNDILEKAKNATFALDVMQLYTKNYLEAGGKRSFSEYYKAVDEKVIFHSFLRKNIVFAQHNLVTDQSFNEFDIIICRNVFIYFNRNLQNQVHKLLYDSLSLSGFIGLGKREGMKFTNYGNCYREIDASDKLYQKIK